MDVIAEQMAMFWTWLQSWIPMDISVDMLRFSVDAGVIAFALMKIAKRVGWENHLYYFTRGVIKDVRSWLDGQGEAPDTGGLLALILCGWLAPVFDTALLVTGISPLLGLRWRKKKKLEEEVQKDVVSMLRHRDRRMKKKLTEAEERVDRKVTGVLRTMGEVTELQKKDSRRLNEAMVSLSAVEGRLDEIDSTTEDLEYTDLEILDDDDF